MKEKALKLLGLANKAGFLVSGSDAITHAMSSNKIKIIFIASDCSKNTQEMFEKKCFYYNVELNNSFSSSELSKSIGKERKTVALCDEGIYNAIKKYL